LISIDAGFWYNRGMSEGPPNDHEFEEQRKEILFNQGCLASLSEPERQWLIHLYDKNLWVANKLKNIFNAKPEDKDLLVQNELLLSLRPITEEIVSDFISVTNEDSPDYRKLLVEFKEQEKVKVLLLEASLAWVKGDYAGLADANRRLFIEIHGLSERVNEFEREVTPLVFEAQVANLDLDHQFVPGSEITMLLSELARSMGRELTNEVLAGILKKSTDKQKMTNLIARLKRALIY